MNAAWLALWAIGAPAAAQDAAPAAIEPVVAPADPAIDPLYDRLLGDAGTAEPAARVAQPAPPSTSALAGLWPLGVAAIGAGLVWVARKRMPSAGVANADAPRVIGRASLGTGAGSVVVVDVRDAAGRTRRLLVSTGSGAPALLADLGEDTRDEAAEQALDLELERSLELQRSAAATASRRSAAPLANGPTAVGRARTAAYAAFSGTTLESLESTEDPASSARRRRPSANVFDEVVGARRGRHGKDASGEDGDDREPPRRARP